MIDKNTYVLCCIISEGKWIHSCWRDITGVPAATAWSSLLGVPDLDFLGFPAERGYKKPSPTRFKHMKLIRHNTNTPSILGHITRHPYPLEHAMIFGPTHSFLWLPSPYRCGAPRAHWYELAFTEAYHGPWGTSCNYEPTSATLWNLPPWVATKAPICLHGLTTPNNSDKLLHFGRIEVNGVN